MYFELHFFFALSCIQYSEQNLQLVAGHEEPTSGEILIGDRAVTHLPAAQRNTSMIFQSYALFPHKTIWQNVEFGLKMRGFSFYWLGQVFQEQRVGNFVEGFQRSFILGITVALVSIIVSVLAGMAFRSRFPGSTAVFYLTIASFIVPSVLISLGIGISFQVLGLSTNWFSSGFGAHLTWTVPFAFLIMLGVFNRFNPSYEEAARDLGAGDVKTFWEIVFPLILPSLIGVGLLGFTLSYDEFTRTSLISGQDNTLPLEIFGMTTNVTSPALYALGTLTTLFSLGMIAIAFATFQFFSRRQQQ